MAGDGVRAIILKSPAEIARMREAGRVVAEVHAALAERLRPGVSTRELDELAEREARRRGARPSFLHYHGYPASTCISVNHVVLHGVPDRRTRLREGDIVSIDFGAELGGYHGDRAVTHAVGQVGPEARRLLEVTEGALAAAIEQALPGKRLGDISYAIQGYVETRGLNVIRGFTGHGIGRSMHEGPSIANQGRAGRGPLLKPGMALAIEPMVTLGSGETITLDDGWTVITADGALAAHFEHTVVITDGAPEILTLPVATTAVAAGRGAGR